MKNEAGLPVNPIEEQPVYICYNIYYNIYTINNGFCSRLLAFSVLHGLLVRVHRYPLLADPMKSKLPKAIQR
jgi:hypothetical protein